MVVVSLFDLMLYVPWSYRDVSDVTSNVMGFSPDIKMK